MLTLLQELASIDNDVKAKFSQYNATKNNLATAQRKQTGNLSTKSLLPIINPKDLIQDSEYLETHLIAVPKALVKDYLKTYESLCELVVPRSSVELAADPEFTLFAVTTFKKTSAEFVHKCREHRWTPRDYRYKEGDREEESKEVDRLSQEERKLWGEALRLGRTGYSDSAMTWVHALALRVFVETVLRYGLPAEFVCALIKVFSVSFIFISRLLTYVTPDNTKGRQKGKRQPGRRLYLPRRQRSIARQEGQGCLGRARHWGQ